MMESNSETITNMKRTILLVAVMLGLSSVLFAFYHRKHSREPQTPTADATVTDSSPSRIQVVFALDATGSMAGLIGAAKEKIWSIASSMSQADPAPQIEMGLLFYRDRGDDFVTKQVPLSGDLDQVYGQLMQIIANGGGDLPESVNQALNESVTRFKWDTASTTYRTVFLVGDCPPHMDYKNDIKYPVTCSIAKQKDIILNTILMGDDQQAKRIWREIAICNQGSFTQVNMNANDIQVYTPYDSIIADISDRLDDSRVYYGTSEEKSAGAFKFESSKMISVNTRANVKAQRAEFNATKTGKVAYYGKKELVENYRDKSVQLDTIRREFLPDEMKDMTVDQRKHYVALKMAQRDSLQKELVKYTNLRQEFIAKDLSTRNASEVDSSFSNQIYMNIRKQTEKKNIHLKAGTKY